MGSVESDTEEAIYVAVGRNSEESKSTLLWTVRNFPGKNICLLHVHQPPASLAVRFYRQLAVVNKAVKHEDNGLDELERIKMDEVLNQCFLILAQEGVEPNKVWIKARSIEEGIIEIVDCYEVKWLVMGAAADKYYSKKLTEVKSKKAAFVCQHAAIFCHIWFVCNGRLIYTRCSLYASKEYISLLLILGSSETGKIPYLRRQRVSNQNLCQDLICHQSCADEVDDAYGIEGLLRKFDDDCSLDIHQPLEMALPLLEYEAVEIRDDTEKASTSSLEESVMDTCDLKKLAFEEAKALESLCIKEISLRKEMEETLAREKNATERTRNQHGKFLKELQWVKEQNAILEKQFGEANSVVQELEEKIMSAVELLISFRKKRDDSRVECENARREVRRLHELGKVDTTRLFRSEILDFSFSEINEATNEFDPAWKIREGRHGTTYKGLLRHVHVAIKMLPSYGSQQEFQNRVKILCKVRHPNLVTLIGTCLEGRSLVLEYARNGSLEDRISCKAKSLPLTWQTRLRIAAEICSALIFLHRNDPCIIHGNLKPSKVLLGTNLVCKLSDFGMHLLVKEKSNPNFVSNYVDPEYLENGNLTPESDVYSFGILLLFLLTARPVWAVVKDVQCALEKEKLETVLDQNAGEWPVELAKPLADLALRCCNGDKANRPKISSVLAQVQQISEFAAATDSAASCLDAKESRRAPSHFVCPIFQEVMQDPQIAADGFTYEGDAIKGWLKSGHNTSPMTNLKMEHCNLLPNHALYQAIQEWHQQHW
uniref:RING-type E3 ubiquitin transferase n=1 Tax=Linum usitatissimum TaxID=4006 RepID=A0A172MLK1_LINUS|nr:putative leucine-rich repeat receptor-like protein kinase [Linum usitatissimum]